LWAALLLPALPAAAQQAPPAARVVVDQVFEKELAPSTEMVGLVDFERVSGLSTEIGGLVEQQSLAEGARVEKGAVLVRLNTDLLVKDAEILEKQILLSDIKIKNARNNLQRFETLYKQDAASEKEYEDLSDRLRELEIEKEILRQRAARKQLEIEKSVIRAPFDGLILAKNTDQGEWVPPGKALCTLASVDEIYVKVAVSEELVRFTRPGSPVSLEIDALGLSLEGDITGLVPVADPKTKTFQVKIAVDYRPGILQNMSARVNVPTGPKSKLRMIKRDALVRFQGKEFVYTVKEGQAKIVPVTIASIQGEYLGVSDPHIVPGMPVVVDGNERLRPDQPVKVVEKE
jgi:RND family efflux transporter MFP subunit